MIYIHSLFDYFYSQDVYQAVPLQFWFATLILERNRNSAFPPAFVFSSWLTRVEVFNCVLIYSWLILRSMKYNNKCCVKLRFWCTHSPFRRLWPLHFSCPYCHIAFLSLKSTVVASFLFSIWRGRKTVHGLVTHHRFCVWVCVDLRHCELWIPLGAGSLNEVVQIHLWMVS